MSTVQNRKHNYNPNQAPHDQADALREKAVEIDSRNLLVRQLKTGQHNLSNDQFWARIGELREKGAI